MTDRTLESLVGCIGPYSLSAGHLKALYEPGYIPDVVIDALMFIICKKYQDVYSICTQSMTKILSGSQRVKSHYFCKKNILKSYERVIGAVLENKNHWTLFFCDLTKQEVTYLDSFGETNEKKEKILKNWSSFAKAKGCILEWKWNDVPHPRQDDGHSCGIHVLMFAQALLDGKGFVDGYSSTDIPQLRAQLCYTLFSSLDRSMKCTVCWGVLIKDKVIRRIDVVISGIIPSIALFLGVLSEMWCTQAFEMSANTLWHMSNLQWDARKIYLK
ncbi:sentrin-specific protease 2-like isoform X2 [Paramisgurnus dabryanus]|uniref:sentrin-specific protease 2-like isoform X2 n=1 Tax=Paramisgurnus dabryanus TaxID=90735 RepID=UPI003CCF270E